MTSLASRSRLAMVSTMVVLREPGEVFLLCHSGGDDAVSWVERIDPETLEPLNRSRDLPAGPTWPGGLAAHANGSLYVVFGRYVHRLSSELDVQGEVQLPRDRPYNSFVVLEGGELVTKDFGGARPGEATTSLQADCEVLVLEPSSLDVLASLTLPEASVARLSALGDEIYVVGVTRLFRLFWRDGSLTLDSSFAVRYVTESGEGYGWDAVITDDHVWFLDNGAGSETFDGSLLDKGISTTSQQLLQVRRSDGLLRRYRVHDEPGSIVANPPCIDVTRNIAIGYDSAHGAVRAFDFSQEGDEALWMRRLNHAMHPVLFEESGHVLLNDFDQERGVDDVVIVDVKTGEELFRCGTESPLQSVLFASSGFCDDVYVCSFTHVTRLVFS
jgi:hypothetical protein